MDNDIKFTTGVKSLKPRATVKGTGEFLIGNKEVTESEFFQFVNGLRGGDLPLPEIIVDGKTVPNPAYKPHK